MKQGTKEFYEAIDMFEKFVKKSFALNLNLNKESNEERQKLANNGVLGVYTNGETNHFFMMFLSGIEAGKFINE